MFTLIPGIINFLSTFIMILIDDEKKAGTITYQSRPAGSIIAERVNLKIKVTKKSETEAGSDHTNTDDGMVPYEEGNNN